MARGSAVGVVGMAAVAVLGWGTAWAASAVDLAPHRAIYDMSLATAKSGSGMAGATGNWKYEFSDTCDGWVVENRIAITYNYTESGQVASTTEFLSWESKDGLRYRFRMRQARDGQVTDDVEGTAELKDKGGAGVAHFTRPEERTIRLPKGTIFPTEHTVRLLEAAGDGGKVLWKVVFDGFGADGPYQINALLGRPSAMPASVSSPLMQPGWPVRMAFFPSEAKDEVPEFEMSMVYQPNGVARDIVQNFKNFSLKGTLSSLEPLPRRRC